MRLGPKREDSGKTAGGGERGAQWAFLDPTPVFVSLVLPFLLFSLCFIVVSCLSFFPFFVSLCFIFVLLIVFRVFFV